MSRQYKRLEIPRGLNKANTHKLRLENDCCAACGTLLGKDSGFCSGLLCGTCICYEDHRAELKELLKMWKEEDNPIKPGMVVQTKDNDYCLVEHVSEEGIYGWSVWHNVTDQGRSLCELRDYRYFTSASIRAVYQLKGVGITYAPLRPNGDSIRKLTSRSGHWERLWEEVDPPVLELTVKDIEKKYGRKVKIVGEKDA